MTSHPPIQRLDKNAVVPVQVYGARANRLARLRALGLPVPAQRFVRDPQDAAAASSRIGYPVVIKPIDGNHGRGVVVNVSSVEGKVAEASG